MSAMRTFRELTETMRPQDPHGDGTGLRFETGEHGGDYPDNMPQAITLTDAEGRCAASNFFLRAALAYAVPAHAPVLVVRRAPQHRQSSETLSCQIVKLAHLSFLFGSRLIKIHLRP